MSRVLVTGASGFVGRHVVEELLAAGHEVHAVSRRGPDRAMSSVPGVWWHEQDLLEAPAVVGDPEVLVHLAWHVDPADYLTSSENLVWVGASLALLRAFAKAGGRRAVLLGTCAEYDWTRGGVLAEGAPVAPATLYGAAKDAVHRVAAAYALQVGVEVAWARLFFLFGPGEPAGRLVPAVARGLLAGQPVETGSGTASRDYLYVQDAAAALAALVPSPVTGAVNIGAGEGIVLRDLIGSVAAETGGEDLVRGGARPDRPGEPPVLVADVARLRDEVGFSPAIGFREGIRRTVADLRGIPETIERGGAR